MGTLALDTNSRSFKFNFLLRSTHENRKHHKKFKWLWEICSHNSVNIFQVWIQNEHEWELNPFVSCSDDPFTIKEENFINVKNDLVHKASFSELELSKF